MTRHYPELRAELIERTPGVIEAVTARLPAGFPDVVAESILSGLKKTLARLRAD